MKNEMLFRMKTVDVTKAISKMNVEELQEHILLAHGIIEKLREQLEDLSNFMAEKDKHGMGKKY